MQVHFRFPLRQKYSVLNKQRIFVAFSRNGPSNIPSPTVFLFHSFYVPTYMYQCVYKSPHICTYIDIPTCMYQYFYKYLHICTYIDLPTYMYQYVYKYLHICTNMSISTYMSIDISVSLLPSVSVPLFSLFQSFSKFIYQTKLVKTVSRWQDGTYLLG